jgi:acetyl-CoA C-acetyltransferase
MREVAILGIGQTPVDEHWDKSLKELAGEAILTNPCLSGTCYPVS